MLFIAETNWKSAGRGGEGRRHLHPNFYRLAARESDLLVMGTRRPENARGNFRSHPAANSSCHSLRTAARICPFFSLARMQEFVKQEANISASMAAPFWSYAWRADHPQSARNMARSFRRRK